MSDLSIVFTFAHYGREHREDLMFCTITGIKTIHPSNHLSPLIQGFDLGYQPKQGSPDFPLPAYFVELFWWNPKVFPGQPGIDLVLLPVGCALNTSAGRLGARATSSSFSSQYGGAAALFRAPPGWQSFLTYLKGEPSHLRREAHFLTDLRNSNTGKLAYLNKVCTNYII